MLDRKKRYLITTLLTVSTLVACSDEGEADSTNDDGLEVITIVAHTSDSPTRVENLEEAGEILNDELEAEEADYRVEVIGEVIDGSWDEYFQQFTLSYQAGEAPDILTIPHEYVGALADGEYILAVDDVRSSDAYQDLYEELWESVEYQGETWGIVQDAEARPVFYSRNLLGELGWSEEEIDSLPDRVEAGEFTLEDLTQTAEEAIEAGIVEAGHGILHRPSNGPDFQMHISAFGGELYDEENHNIILDKSAVLQSLEYYEDIVEREVTPADMTSIDFDNVHQMTVNEEALFYYGGIWNVFNWENNTFHDELGSVDAEWYAENMGMFLVPAAEENGTPVTLSRPSSYTVVSSTEHEEAVKRVLEHVVDPELQTYHNLETWKLPITESAAQDADFEAHPALGELTYMLEYATFQPIHEQYPMFSAALFDSIQAVQLGESTPEEALDNLELRLENELGENLTVVE